MTQVKRQKRSAFKTALESARLSLTHAQNQISNFYKRKKRDPEWLERHMLIDSMTNYQRTMFMRATSENEGPLPIERVREFADLMHWKKRAV